MKTSGQQSLFSTEEGSMSCQPVSLANHTAWQEKDKAQQMTETCGLKPLEQLNKFSRIGLWVKMFSALLIGQKGWSSTKCRLIWKLQGTKFSRFYFRLHLSEHHTEGTESGLSHTENPGGGVQICAGPAGIVANAKVIRMEGNGTNRQQVAPIPIGQILSGRNHARPDWSQWPSKPGIRGRNDGIPNRMDRVKALGNSIVPQVAFQIFKAIEQYQNEHQ